MEAEQQARHQRYLVTRMEVDNFPTNLVTRQKIVSYVHRAYANHRLARRLRIYIKPGLLILDEAGYLPLEPTDAALLFFWSASAMIADCR